MPPRFSSHLLLAAAFLALCRPAPAAQPVSFTREIAPILLAKCQACHGPDKAKGGFRLHTFDDLMKGGESKMPPVAAGKPDASRLYQLITAADADDRMPQKDDPLTPQQVRLIALWIEQGAKFDGEDRAALLATLVPLIHPAAPQAYRRPVPIRALAFRPDGKELAVGGYHEITLWDPGTGTLIARLGNVAEQTHSLAYSADGQLLAAAGGTPGRVGEVKLFDVNKRTELKSLERAGDSMLALSFSPDGQRLAAAGTDNAIHVYDVKTGRRELRAEVHADWITAVAFNADGSRILSASRDKTSRFIDAASGEVLATYTADEPLLAAALAGQAALTGGRDRKVTAWATKDGAKTATLDTFGGDVLRLVATKELLFSACSDKKVRQHTPPKLDFVREYPHDEWVYALAYHENTKRLATGAFNGAVRIWEGQNVEPIKTFIAAPGYRPEAH